MGRKVLIGSIALVLLLFFSAPLFFIAYGGANALLGAVIFFAPLIALQAYVLKAMRRVSTRRDSKPTDPPLPAERA